MPHHAVVICTSDNNKKAGPTTLWKTLKGKNVKTNDGKDLGEIKEISDNYVHVQKGTIRNE
jgi:sporulation protein YlmC with PRC-barrel domain